MQLSAMIPWRVLVFPGGTEIGLEINSALRECKEVELYSAGSPVSNHAPFVFKVHDIVPYITEENWLEELERVLQLRGIDFIIPAHDDVLLALARVRQRLSARLVCSPLETCEITRSKSATYQRLLGKVAVPTIYAKVEEVLSYPVFVKPDRGQGAQFAAKVENADELRLALGSRREMIALEYLPGEEYTIDCFSDRDRGLLYCSGRRRVRVRAGISVATHLVPCQEFNVIAGVISASMTFHGAWFFQLKRSREGVLTLLEVAPRVAGAMALNRVMGMNFPLLSIFEMLRYPISVLTNLVEAQLDRCFINRYRSNISIKNVYIDLDDTLVIKKAVNLSLIRLIYQWINTGVRLCLITRHQGDVQQTLVRYRMHGLFDRVVHLKDREPKSVAIDLLEDAIFIDDSFSERREVYETTGIMTFDNSMLELLHDYRA